MLKPCKINFVNFRQHAPEIGHHSNVPSASCRNFKKKHYIISAAESSVNISPGTLVKKAYVQTHQKISEVTESSRNFLQDVEFIGGEIDTPRLRLNHHCKPNGANNTIDFQPPMNLYIL